MDVLLMIESSLCALYVTITAPIVRLGNAWMDRMDRISRPEVAVQREPTVADITPAGYITVMAMGPNGQWQVLHDYPIRLLPPGIQLVNDQGERVR